MKKQIGILMHDKVGCAEQTLSRILIERGYEASIIDPRKVFFNLETVFPDLVVARCELSSFAEEVFTTYLVYLEECKKRSIPVINDKDFMITGQNKYLSHLAVRKYFNDNGTIDIINPRTYFVVDKQKAIEIGEEEIQKYGSVVIKHPASGRGDGVYFCSDLENLKNILKEKFTPEQGILLQQTIEKEIGEQGGCRDMRIWVCRNPKTNEGEVVSAYYRNAPVGKFLTNQSQGATISKMDKIDDELIKYCSMALDATGGDVTGMDFARDSKGRYWFEEVNIAFETLDSQIALVGEDIWHRVADLIESKLK